MWFLTLKGVRDTSAFVGFALFLNLRYPTCNLTFCLNGFTQKQSRWFWYTNRVKVTSVVDGVILIYNNLWNLNYVWLNFQIKNLRNSIIKGGFDSIGSESYAGGPALFVTFNLLDLLKKTKIFENKTWADFNLSKDGEWCFGGCRRCNLLIFYESFTFNKQKITENIINKKKKRLKTPLYRPGCVRILSLSFIMIGPSVWL